MKKAKDKTQPKKSSPLQVNQQIAIFVIAVIMGAPMIVFIGVSSMLWMGDSTASVLSGLLALLFGGVGLAWIYLILDFEEIGDDEYKRKTLLLLIFFLVSGLLLVAFLVLHFTVFTLDESTRFNEAWQLTKFLLIANYA